MVAVRVYVSHHTTKPTKWHVLPAKTQISLGINPVWSVFTVHSIGSFFMWTAKPPIRLGGCPGCSVSSLAAQVILLVLSCGGSCLISGHHNQTSSKFIQSKETWCRGANIEWEDTWNCKFIIGPRQANLVLIAYASSKGSGEPAHPRSLARTFAARSYKQWIKRNLQTENQIPGPSEWLDMRSWNLSWRNAQRHKFAWRGPIVINSVNKPTQNSMLLLFGV